MKEWRIIVRVFSIAYDIVGALVIGLFLGMLLDRYLHTKAIFTILLSLWGIFHGFKMMMKIGE